MLGGTSYQLIRIPEAMVFRAWRFYVNPRFLAPNSPRSAFSRDRAGIQLNVYRNHLLDTIPCTGIHKSLLSTVAKSTVLTESKSVSEERIINACNLLLSDM